MTNRIFALALLFLVSSPSMPSARASDESAPQLSNPIVTSPVELMPGVTKSVLVKRSGWTNLIRRFTGEPSSALKRNAMELNMQVDLNLGQGNAEGASELLIEVMPLSSSQPMALSVKDMWYSVEHDQLRMQNALERLSFLHKLWDDSEQGKRGQIEQMAAAEQEAYLASAKTLGPYHKYYLGLRAHLERSILSGNMTEKWIENAKRLIAGVGVRESRMRDTMAEADLRFFEGLRELGVANLDQLRLTDLSASSLYGRALESPVLPEVAPVEYLESVEASRKGPEEPVQAEHPNPLSLDAIRERSRDSAVSHNFSVHSRRYQFKDLAARLGAIAPLQASLTRLSKRPGALGEFLKGSQFIQKVTAVQRDADLWLEYGFELMSLERNIDGLTPSEQLAAIERIRMKGTEEDQKNWVVLEYMARNLDLRDKLWEPIVEVVRAQNEGDRYFQLKERVAQLDSWTRSKDFVSISSFSKPSPLRRGVDWGLAAFLSDMTWVHVVHPVLQQTAGMLHTSEGAVAAGVAVAAPVAVKAFKAVKAYRARPKTTVHGPLETKSVAAP